MGFVRVFVISAALFVTAVVFGVVPASLPHPACHHNVMEWTVHEQPGALTDVYAPNTALQLTKRLLNGKMHGSESVAISPSGNRVFLADKFGGIHSGRLMIDGHEVEIQLDPDKPVLHVKGRPLGIHALTEDRLLVCDSVEGLLDVDLTKATYDVLTQKAKSNPRRHRTSKIVYANDVDVAEDGMIYFTDSTDIPVDKGSEGFYSTFRTFVLNLMEGRPTGRLISFDPKTNATTELIGGLWYANGVAVAKDGSFVAVVETNGFRVHRYWINGPYANTKDVLISNLPGFPDGISTAPDGNFWIALVSPGLPYWKILQYKLPRLAYAWISEYISIPVRKWGYVVKVSPKGDVLTILSDVEGGFISSVSSATERDGKLFLGNLHGDYISVFNLKLIQDSEKDTEEPKQEL